MNRFKTFALCAVAMGAVGVFGAPVASAHNGHSVISCDGVQFTYADFPDGATIDRQVVWVDDGNEIPDIEQTDIPAEDNFVPLNLTGTHWVGAYATWNADGEERHLWRHEQVDCGGEQHPGAATDEITCDGVDFHYTDFPDPGSVDTQVVFVDDGSVIPDDVQNDLPVPPEDYTVPLDLAGTGSHTVGVYVAWTGDDGPHTLWDQQNVDCGGGGHSGEASIDISCDGVTFHYTDFPDPGSVDRQQVWVDDGSVFPDDVQTDLPVPPEAYTVPLDLTDTGTHTIGAFASWQGDDGPHSLWTEQDVDCGTPHHNCPPGNISMRWHYSYLGTSGSWSATKSTTCPGTLTFQQQGMEGDLKVTPGEDVKVGYSFKKNGGGPVTVSNAKLVFTINCVGGGTPSAATWTVDIPDQTYPITSNDRQPSGDQHSSLVYQRPDATMPDFCNGAKVRLNKGGVFSADFS